MVLWMKISFAPAKRLVGLESIVAFKVDGLAAWDGNPLQKSVTVSTTIVMVKQMIQPNALAQ